MFECMEIEESIYEVLVELPNKKPTRVDSNRASYIRKIRGEAAPSNTYSKMIDSDGKFRKKYVYCPKHISKHTCLVHGPGRS